MDDLILILACSADEVYFMTTKKVLQLTTRIHDLFIGSEIDEKRHLINFALLNLKVDTKIYFRTSSTSLDKELVQKSGKGLP